MHIVGLAHLAIWTRDIETASAFWREHFDAEIGEFYESKRRVGFVSRFVTLPGTGLRIELMQGPWVEPPAHPEAVGWAHVALSLGSREAVDAAAARFSAAGLLVAEPRLTGDGFYEALIRTPDGVLIELLP